MSNVLEEFEGPQDRIAEGLNVPTVRDPRFLELTPADKVQLVNFYRSPAYAVVMKLLEGEAEKAETQHMVAWRDQEKFLSTGYVAVAFQMMFERIQAEIKRQVEEFAGELQFIKQKQEQQKISIEEQVEQSFQ
jgi:hypothetical protein